MGDSGARVRSGPASVVASATAGNKAVYMAKDNGNAVAVAEHLSPVVEAAIRLLPGNDRCVDCKAVYPQWAGVSFGVLLCLACAGKHRSLGVNVSFVKSLAMDTWSPTEQRALETGGNAKWVAVCAGSTTVDLPIAQKYTSSVAKAYKHRILVIANAKNPVRESLSANEFLAQLMLSVSTPASPAEVASLRASILDDSPRASKAPAHNGRHPTAVDEKTAFRASEGDFQNRSSRVYSTDLVVKCTTCQNEISLHEIDGHSKRCVVRAPSTAAKWRKYDRKFGRPGVSLGLSLTKTKGGFAEVTRIAPDGDAAEAEVLVGSYVVGLNGHKTSVFDEIVALVSTLPRPIHFHFVFRATQNGAHTRSSSVSSSDRHSPTVQAAISSVPEPVSVEVEAVFGESVKEIGCVLQVQNNRCVVKHVDAGSAASKQGVLVGSSVAAVNGRPVLRGGDAIEAIQKSSRPLRIKFHRVEGLMRGWKSS